MSGFYDGADGRRTYRFAALTVTSAAVIGRIQGPAGKVGRVVGFEYILTTGVTVGDAGITIDTNAGLTAPFTTSMPIAAVNTGGAATAAQLKAGDELPADTVVELSSDAAATAGAADVTITIAWY
jgi:hypothetical protein